MSEQVPDWHSEFPPHSLEVWESQVAKSLKEGTADDLHWKPEPGIDLAAYYTAENVSLPDGWEENRPGEFPFLRGSGRQGAGDGWQLIQEIDVNQPRAKKEIREAKAAGVQAFSLRGKTASADVWELLDLEQIAIHLAVDAAPILSTTDMKLILSLQRVKQEKLTGTLRNDPISQAAATGEVMGEAGWVACEGGIKNMVNSPHFRSLGLDFSYVKQRGGAVVHELAFALGTVVEYLDQLGRMGHEVEELLGNISVSFSLGNRFFLELAKFRAFRVLYAQVVAAYGVEEESLLSSFLMARTAEKKPETDLPNHLLSSTTQSISAILGGVDGLIAESGEQGDAARLSRNIQHLLRHESQLHLVQDPAGGAYYIEVLTHQLAREAWKLFQKMEASGGFLANIRNGRVPGLMEAYRRLEEERSETIIE